MTITDGAPGQLDQRSVAGGEAVARLAAQCEGVLDPEPGEPLGQLGRRLKLEGMVTVAGPGVVGREALVDEERQAQLVGSIGSEPQREVVLGAPSGLEPVEDQVAVGAGGWLAGGMDPEVADQRGHAGGTPEGSKCCPRWKLLIGCEG